MFPRMPFADDAVASTPMLVTCITLLTNELLRRVNCSIDDMKKEPPPCTYCCTAVCSVTLSVLSMNTLSETRHITTRYGRNSFKAGDGAPFTMSQTS